MADHRFLDSGAQLLGASLTGLARRQQLIGNNLANVDTPGYRAYDTPFEQVLDSQLKREAPLSLATTSPGHLRLETDPLGTSATSQSQLVFRGDGNGVDVDAEMARLSETAIEFNAVSQLLTARLSLLRMAVSEGRR